MSVASPSSPSSNALGQPDNLITSYLEYQRLGATDEKRREAYRQLFEQPVAEQEISQIREATNKAWVLGSDRFKQAMQEKLKRPVEPATRGGDRRSEQFRINRI